MSKRRVLNILMALGCAAVMLYAWLASQPVSVIPYSGLASSGATVQVLPVEVPLTGIEVNLADADELTELPGIGEKYAQAIITERETNGLFHYPEDLTAVSGIGAKRLAAIRDLISMATE